MSAVPGEGAGKARFLSLAQRGTVLKRGFTSVESCGKNDLAEAMEVGVMTSPVIVSAVKLAPVSPIRMLMEYPFHVAASSTGSTLPSEIDVFLLKATNHLVP
jgi:hypothetical protein